ELVGLTFSSPSSTASAHPLSLHDALPISPADDGALDVLLVGSDSRTDAQGNPLPESVLKELRTESTSGLNTDTLIVVRIPHNGSSPTAVSIPRDTYTPVPGGGREKINAVRSEEHTSELQSREKLVCRL